MRPRPRNGVIADLVLVCDGKVLQSLQNGDMVDVTKCRQIAIEAVTRMRVKDVRFKIGRKKVWVDFHRPYFLYGNRGRVPTYSQEPPVNKWFTLRTAAGGDVDRMAIILVRN